MRARVLTGDCLNVLPTLDADSVDAIVTDPPYHLGFMGKAWEGGDVSFRAETWVAVLRVAKPGAHLVAFGGTRTFHRLTCAIEDAGWEIRDCLSWLYGSGFPKSLDVSKALDKRRDDRAEVLCVTAWIRAARDRANLTNADLDAAFGFHGMAGHWTSNASQPEVPTLDQWAHLMTVLRVDDVPADIQRLAVELNGMKGQPGEAWFRREVTGRDNKGAAIWGSCDGEYAITTPATDAAKQWQGWGTALKPAWEPIILARKPLGGTVAANVQAHGTGALNIDGCRIGTESTLGPRGRGSFGLINDDGWTPKPSVNGSESGRWPANVVLDEDAAAMLDAQSGEVKSPGSNSSTHAGFQGGGRGVPLHEGYGDNGGASRFFYTSKASRAERNAGLDELAARRSDYRPNDDAESDTIRERLHGSRAARNHHPTVKPLDLMQWLCRLVTPKGGLVLDPFCGSGTTGRAAVAEGFAFLGIDLDPEYAAIAQARIDEYAPLFAVVDQREMTVDPEANAQGELSV
jgi:DNA modification methylase